MAFRHLDNVGNCLKGKAIVRLETRRALGNVLDAIADNYSELRSMSPGNGRYLCLVDSKLDEKGSPYRKILVSVRRVLCHHWNYA